MKTLLLLFLICTICFSCTKESIEDIAKAKDVKFSLDYAFQVNSGDMVAKGSSSYSDFYNKYIIGRILTPKTYRLTFENLETYFRMNSMGKWGTNNFISLPAGTYSVTGESFPLKYYESGDTCQIAFDDNITITSNTTSIILPAKYNCSLFLIDNTNVEKVDLDQSNGYYTDPNNERYKSTLLKTEEFYHTFILTRTLMEWSNKYRPYFSLSITKTDDSVTDVALWNTTSIWDIGKYYYFVAPSKSFMPNNYVIPQMPEN